MSNPIQSTNVPASSQRFNGQTLITALALVVAIALHLSDRSLLLPSIAAAQTVESKESSEFYLALHHLKQTITDVTQDAEGDRSIPSLLWR